VSVSILSSVARISDIESSPFGIEKLPRELWAGGDYVDGEVSGIPTSLYQVEKPSGRMVKALPGDHVIGAFGNREATLEGVGSWSAIEGTTMHALTSAGVFGAFTSLSKILPAPMLLHYRGHIVRGGRKVCMHDFAMADCGKKVAAPVVLIVGTSMSSGKTTTAGTIIHELANLNLNVVGAKLTGAGRFRDILSFRDAGASAIFDFVDAGLPSTVVTEDIFLAAIRPIMSKIGSLNPDVLVVEAGASPLEPYNGAAAFDVLSEHIRCIVLCASDPYSVVGVCKAFGLRPDLVCGPAASTSAGVNLVRKLTGIRAINNIDPAALPEFREVLHETLGIQFPSGAG
jgi:hypothetical protein